MKKVLNSQAFLTHFYPIKQIGGMFMNYVAHKLAAA